MSFQTEFLNCLEKGDIDGLCQLWRIYAPDRHQPDRDEAEFIMHCTRTEIPNISFKERAYSHAWLKERNLPSRLPDHLKPKAERLYPRVFGAVGISFNAKNPIIKPAAKIIQKAMCDAVEDIYANGDQEKIELIKQRMEEAKTDELKRLFGRLS